MLSLIYTNPSHNILPLLQNTQNLRTLVPDICIRILSQHQIQRHISPFSPPLSLYNVDDSLNSLIRVPFLRPRYRREAFNGSGTCCIVIGDGTGFVEGISVDAFC